MHIITYDSYVATTPNRSIHTWFAAPYNLHVSNQCAWHSWYLEFEADRCYTCDIYHVGNGFDLIRVQAVILKRLNRKWYNIQQVKKSSES